MSDNIVGFACLACVVVIAGGAVWAYVTDSARFRREAAADRGRREVHGLTVPQLLDLVEHEVDLEADPVFRETVQPLLDQLPKT